MNAQQTIGAGLATAVIGAILAFALDDPNAEKLGISLVPLGGILLATGVLIAAGAAIVAAGATGGSGSNSGLVDPVNLKSIVGLVAVVAGITAVTALTVVTVTMLDNDDTDSMVAVTSSSFGVISAVISAYLGIKITAETSAKASDDVKQAAGEAAVAQQEADKAQQKAATYKTLLTPEQEREVERKLAEADYPPPDPAVPGDDAP